MIIILGFFWGSFIAVILYRAMHLIDIWLPLQSITSSSHTRLQRVSWAYLFLGRSQCDHCGAQIRWYHNIPLISYLLLRGRCADCGHKISTFFWFLEWFFLIIAIILHFTVSDLVSQYIYLAAISLLVLIAYIDLYRQVIPDVLSYLLFWLGILYLFVNPVIGLFSVMTALVAYLVLKLLQLIYLLGLKKMALGDADPLLAFALGIWLPLELLPYWFMLSAGTTIAVVMWQHGRQARASDSQPFLWKQHFPFGPGLVLGALLCFIYQQI